MTVWTLVELQLVLPTMGGTAAQVIGVKDKPKKNVKILLKIFFKVCNLKQMDSSFNDIFCMSRRVCWLFSVGRSVKRYIFTPWREAHDGSL